MTYEDFKDEIIVSLGGNLIDVELEDREIRVAFNRAKRTYQQKGPNNQRRAFFKLPVNDCDQEYIIPNKIDTVVKVVKPAHGYAVGDAFTMAAYNELFTDIGVAGAGGFDELSYEFTLQRVERIKRMTAYYTNFDHDKHRNIIRFHNKPEQSTYVWLLDCYYDLEDEEYMDMLWIQSWATAEAKEILGAAYRKFSSLPSPDGGSISLNGDSLIQEAKQEKEALLEDIANGVAGDTDFYEITMG